MNKPDPTRKVKAILFQMDWVDPENKWKGLQMVGDYEFEYHDESVGR